MNDELRNDEAKVSALRVPALRSVLRNLVVVLIVVSLSVSAVWVLGVNRYEEPTLAEKKAELVTLLSDGELDSGLALAELLQVDLSTLGEYVRPVSVSAVQYLSKAQVLEILQQQNPEAFKTFDDIPQEIKDGFNENGEFPRAIANSGVNSFLINGRVAIPSSVFNTIFSQPPQAGKSIKVEVRLLADPSVEDEWKEELLFSGNAIELVEALSTHAEIEISFIDRPDSKILVESVENPYDVVKVNEVNPTAVVVYGNSVSTLVAKVSRIVEDRGILVLTGSFTAQDFGVPVFVLRDGKALWAGNIVAVSDAHTAVVAGSEAIQHKALGR